MKTVMKTWTLASMMFVGFFLAHASASSEGALEQARIETFADALMDNETPYVYAHVRDIKTDDVEWKELRKWYHPLQHRIYPLYLDFSYPMALPSIVFEFDGIGAEFPPPEDKGPTLIIGRESEWLLVLEPLQGDEWEELMAHMTKVGVEHPIHPGNVIKVFRASYGAICIRDDWQPFAPERMLPKGKIYPATVVQEVCRIRDVMSGGGDTNALLALEAELEVDFSRKLVQEIVRRKQPPTQEEIWRESIDELWKFRWKGERINTSQEVHAHFNELEQQFRAAHEAGELSDETYLEFMRKLGVDIKKDPASTPFPYKPPLTAPGKSAD